MGAARDLLERNITNWNNHDEAAWMADTSDDGELAAPGIRGSGRETARQFYAVFQDAFPDCHIRTTRIVEEGQTVGLEAVFEGTHSAALNVSSGSIPATGKRVSIPYAAISIVAGEKFASFALYYDRVELLTQLGLMPLPASVAT